MKPTTMTIRDLLANLQGFVKQEEKLLDYKIYLSKDSEGNSYGTLDPSYSLQFSDVDEIMTIMPFQEGLFDEDIAPIESKE